MSEMKRPMRGKVAIIHTTVVTVEPLKALAAELLPDYEAVNFVDDSILLQLRESDGDVRVVADRVLQYARFAEQVGASAILNACSSVGGLVAETQQQVGIPIVRIDEAMAEEAVRRGRCVGVAATLATTLEPTMHLVRGKAREAGKDVELKPLLASAAYEKLVAGDTAGHDRILREALADLAASVDVVVLAQASMARVVRTLPEEQQHKYLSSPRLGMERVKAVLQSKDQ